MSAHCLEEAKLRDTNIQKLNSHHEKRSKLIVMMFSNWLWACVRYRYSIYEPRCRLTAGVGSRSQPCKWMLLIINLCCQPQGGSNMPINYIIYTHTSTHTIQNINLHILLRMSGLQKREERKIVETKSETKWKLNKNPHLMSFKRV